MHEGYDEKGNACVKATVNPDRTTTFINESSKGCIVQLGHATLKLAPYSEIKLNAEREKGNPIL